MKPSENCARSRVITSGGIISRELQHAGRRRGIAPDGAGPFLKAESVAQHLRRTGYAGPSEKPIVAAVAQVEHLTRQVASGFRALGATVLAGLHGNISIPRRTGSSTTAWVAENAAITASDPTFDAVTLSPKHAGAIHEWSRNMIQQASPDVEQLAHNDLALILAEALDLAAINGSGASNQPLGILGTAGIGSVAIGTNGGPITWDKVVDLMAEVEIDNAEGSGFLLARTGSGTLRLAEDSRGLHFEIDVPDTQLGRDVLALAERRDLGGMSFSFHPRRQAWPATDRRELRAVDLIEVSVVQAFPAYAATSVSARSATHGAAWRRRLVEAL